MNCCTRTDYEIYALLMKNEYPKEAKDWLSKQKKKRKYTLTDDDKWVYLGYGDFDSYAKKRFFNSFFTDEEWEEFVDCEWIYTGCAFDCSGRPFTISIDRYKTTNGTWVYHWIGLDV